MNSTRHTASTPMLSLPQANDIPQTSLSSAPLEQKRWESRGSVCLVPCYDLRHGPAPCTVVLHKPRSPSQVVACPRDDSWWGRGGRYLPSRWAAPPSVTVLTKMPSFSRPMSAPAPMPMMLMPRPSASVEERAVRGRWGGERGWWRVWR